MHRDKTILIVDDEPHVRRVTELSLKPLGCRIRLAGNGLEALSIARQIKPCIIVLDHVMPVMDGQTTLEALKADRNTSDIPVVILSARGQLATGNFQGFEGACMFVTKPFSPRALRLLIKNLIESVIPA